MSQCSDRTETAETGSCMDLNRNVAELGSDRDMVEVAGEGIEEGAGQCLDKG